MNNKLFEDLQKTSDKHFGKDSLKIETKYNNGIYISQATINGITNIVEAQDENKDKAQYKALTLLAEITYRFIENNLVPTKPIEQYEPVTLSIQDLVKDGGLIQGFLDNYIEKYEDVPQVLITNIDDKYECVINSNESNIHVKMVGNTKLEAVEHAVRIAYTVMYPMKLVVGDLTTKIN